MMRSDQGRGYVSASNIVVLRWKTAVEDSEPRWSVLAHAAGFMPLND